MKSKLPSKMCLQGKLYFKFVTVLVLLGKTLYVLTQEATSRTGIPNRHAKQRDVCLSSSLNNY